MSAFTEYKYAKTEEEREDALKGMRAECERDYYFDEFEHDYEESEDDDYE